MSIKNINARFACLCAFVWLWGFSDYAYGKGGKAWEPRKNYGQIEAGRQVGNDLTSRRVKAALDGAERAKLAAEFESKATEVHRSLADLEKAARTIAQGPDFRAEPREKYDIKPTHQAAINKLADLAAGYSDRVADRISKDAGFDVSKQGELWNSFSELRKIEIVVLAANDISPENAEHALARMIRSLALDYPSIWNEPEFDIYTKRPFPASRPQYRYSDFENRTIPEGSKWRSVIYAIHRYCFKGNVLNAAMLIRKMNLPLDAEYEILRRCSTSICVLTQGFGRVLVQSREVVIRNMVRLAVEKYSSSLEESAFQPYLRSLSTEQQTEVEGGT